MTNWRKDKNFPKDQIIIVCQTAGPKNKTYIGHKVVFPAYCNNDGIPFDIETWSKPIDNDYWTIIAWQPLPEYNDD